jgi:transcriptional regulator with XRE-family HTH domain
VREARSGRRISQEELSLAAGLNRQFVNELESGRRRVSFESVCAIAEAMDMPMSELVERFERAQERDRRR